MSDSCRAVAFLLVVACAAGPIASGEATAPEAVLRSVNAAWHPIDEGTIAIRVIVRRPGKPDSENQLEVSVNRNDRALCDFRSGKQKGRKVLLAGRSAWLIVPGAARAVPITERQRLVGGVSVADVARLRFAESFDATERPGESDEDGVRCRVINLRAKSRDVAYASGTLWVATADGRALRARLAYLSGREAKEIVFAAYGVEGAATVGRRLEFRDLLTSKPGEVTVLEYLRYQAKELDPSIFEPPGPRDRSPD